jgi:hypothetical protein
VRVRPFSLSAFFTFEFDVTARIQSGITNEIKLGKIPSAAAASRSGHPQNRKKLLLIMWPDIKRLFATSCNGSKLFSGVDSESARSAREHKASGAASEASKPQDRNQERVGARGASDRCGVRWQSELAFHAGSTSRPRAVTRSAVRSVLCTDPGGSRPRNYEAGSPKVDLKVGEYPT